MLLIGNILIMYWDSLIKFRHSNNRISPGQSPANRKERDPSIREKVMSHFSQQKEEKRTGRIPTNETISLAVSSETLTLNIPE
jgi:hypothetical protein